MKNFSLYLLLVLCTVLGPAAAYGARAAAEEMSYWLLYSLEGDIGRTKDNRVVAAGCGAEMGAKDGKCSLKQFLQYIWHARHTDPASTPRPTAELRPFKKGVSVESASLDQLYNNILDSPYIDGLDANRLSPGSESYYKARETVFSVLPSIEEMYPKATLEDKRKQKSYDRIRTRIQKAKSANEVAFMVRFKDFEGYRIQLGGLEGQFGKKIATKQVATGLGTEGSFKTLDASATLAMYPDNENIATDLRQACKRFRMYGNQPVDQPDGLSDEERRTRRATLLKASEHWKALQAARAAVGKGKCSMPEVRL